ncbi:hypothetical protein P4639_27790 [Priestia megaterium]|uniref:hypothetical protein n=1 Tax=Priestia megaterium TaxID=1404 RepID=UPI002E1E8601|nr:hypothetical protein [Priestia megaterium]
MIGIKVHNKSIVDKHYEAILKYFNTKRIKYNYEKIDKWIEKLTDGEFNLEKTIRAEPKDLKILTKINEKSSYKGKIEDASQDSDYSIGQYFIYTYKKFSTRDDKHFNEIGYNALTLINHLGISVCPYCNRNFITNTKLIDKNNNKYIKRTAQLDHFYPESKYPYLALSYYNLIPVCGSCNMIKSNNLVGVNPYEITNSDEHLIFDYNFGKSISESTVDTVFLSNEFKKNWTELGLEELYNSHNNYLVDLLYRILIYNSLYKKDLSTYFNKWSNGANSETEITLTKEDFERIIYGNHYLEHNLNKHPLSKLTKDIVRQYS